MQLQDILRDLSYNELSNHSMSEEGSGTIREDSIPKVVTSINSVMRRLHNQFSLKKGSIRLVLIKDVNRYELKSEYAYTKNTPPVPGRVAYIADSEDDPFIDDILQILEVRDRQGRIVPLNDPDKPFGIRNTRPDLIFFREDKYCGELHLTYKAKFQPIVLDLCELDHDVVIPDQLYKALTAGVAAEIYGAMNGQDNQLNAQNFSLIYSTTCDEVALVDSISETTSETGTLFEKNGWV